MITENDFEKFVETGKVSQRILKLIATKVMLGEELDSYETAIFYGLTMEINKMILKLTTK